MNRIVLAATACFLGASGTGLSAQVVLVEPGHTLTKLVDSAAPTHPSDTLLDALPGPFPINSIESIGIDPAAGLLYVQLIDPFGSPVSTTSHIFSITLAAPHVVTPCSLFTGLGINERGTDLHVDPASGRLVTQDQNFVFAGGSERIATVDCATGIVGTYSLVTTPPIFGGGTFGMQFSTGAGGSDVPAGDIVFVSDVGAGGLHSVTFGGPGSVTHVPMTALPGGGDDMVIQPSGDWVWIGDSGSGIISFSPTIGHLATPSPLDVLTLFAGAGLPAIFGTRATVCPRTGNVYVSFSGGTGGSGIFRIDPTLTTGTLLLTIGLTTGAEGLHDLTFGPSSTGTGDSVYFTVQDLASGGKQVWEMTTLPGCCPPFPAIELPRAGAPPNPGTLLPGVTGPPIIGTTWAPVIPPFLPGAFADVLIASPTPINLPIVFGTLLCVIPAPPGIFFALPAGTPFAVPIPLRCSLVGLPYCTQGGSIAPGPVIALTNALDVVFGTF